MGSDRFSWTRRTKNSIVLRAFCKLNANFTLKAVQRPKLFVLIGAVTLGSASNAMAMEIENSAESFNYRPRKKTLIYIKFKFSIFGPEKLFFCFYSSKCFQCVEQRECRKNELNREIKQISEEWKHSGDESNAMVASSSHELGLGQLTLPRLVRLCFSPLSHGLGEFAR